MSDPDVKVRPKYSIVITCYFEENSVEEFYRRLRATLDQSGATFEIVMVNDGSTDRTYQLLKEIHARDSNVTVVEMFRNYGQACALTAGIQEAEGRNFIFLDSDLQLDPEDRIRFTDGSSRAQPRRAVRSKRRPAVGRCAEERRFGQ